jgi:REP element-mobilizing transposase RayT
MRLRGQTPESHLRLRGQTPESHLRLRGQTGANFGGGRPNGVMPRQARVELAGGIHHVVGKATARRVLFHSDRDRQLYLRLLAREVRERRWRVLTFCLMTNHAHLLVLTPEPDLGLGFKRIHEEFAQSINREQSLRSNRQAPPRLLPLHRAQSRPSRRVPATSGLAMERPSRARWPRGRAAVPRRRECIRLSRCQPGRCPDELSASRRAVRRSAHDGAVCRRHRPLAHLSCGCLLDPRPSNRDIPRCEPGHRVSSARGGA